MFLSPRASNPWGHHLTPTHRTSRFSSTSPTRPSCHHTTSRPRLSSSPASSHNLPTTSLGISPSTRSSTRIQPPRDQPRHPEQPAIRNHPAASLQPLLSVQPPSPSQPANSLNPKLPPRSPLLHPLRPLSRQKSWYWMTTLPAHPLTHPPRTANLRTRTLQQLKATGSETSHHPPRSGSSTPARKAATRTTLAQAGPALPPVTTLLLGKPPACLAPTQSPRTISCILIRAPALSSTNPGRSPTPARRQHSTQSAPSTSRPRWSTRSFPAHLIT
jgi:hypothetical protein